MSLLPIPSLTNRYRPLSAPGESPNIPGGKKDWRGLIASDSERPSHRVAHFPNTAIYLTIHMSLGGFVFSAGRTDEVCDDIINHRWYPGLTITCLTLLALLCII